MNEKKINSILFDLDHAIATINDPNFDMAATARTISDACEFMVITMNNNESKISELQAELKDAYETINALIESNDILQVDLQIILGFLKQNNIDLSYVVKKTDIVKPTKKKKKKSE